MQMTNTCILLYRFNPYSNIHIIILSIAKFQFLVFYKKRDTKISPHAHKSSTSSPHEHNAPSQKLLNNRFVLQNIIYEYPLVINAHK